MGKKRVNRTPEERAALARSERARIAANARIADPAYDATAATAAARAGRWAKLCATVNPDGTLPPDVVAQKARALQRAQLAAGRLKRLTGGRP